MWCPAIAVLILASIIDLAAAQEWRKEDLDGPRVFIGLTKGSLRSESETHLRSFIVLRKLVRNLETRLKNNVVKVVTAGDLPLWVDTDEDWKALARRGYTHYLVAVPEIENLKEMQVYWRAGKLFSAEKRSLEMGLIVPTRISLPSEIDEAFVKDKGETDPGATRINEAERLERSFQALFPETKLDRKYAIRCINNLTQWKEAAMTIMAWLSSDLQIHRWTPERILSLDDAEALCKTNFSGRDADLIIGGWFMTIPSTGAKQRYRPRIDLEHTAPQQRKNIAIVYHEDDGSNSYRRRLDEFCIEEGADLTRVLDDLVRYIQAHRDGLNIQAIKYVPSIKCD